MSISLPAVSVGSTNWGSTVNGYWQTIQDVLNGLFGQNAIINGGFDFFQRQPPATFTDIFVRSGGSWPSTRKYSADRWAVQTNETLTNGHGVQARRYDSGLSVDTGQPKAGSFKRIVATGTIAVYQILESLDSVKFRGRKVCFQCKVKSKTNNQTVRLGIAKYSGTTPDLVVAKAIASATPWSANPTLGTDLAWLANSSDVTALTSGWTSASVTADLTSETTFNNLLVFIYNSATTMAAGDELLLSEAGLYDSVNTRDWFPRPIQQELAMCQRYYCKSYNVDVAPGNNGAGSYLDFMNRIVIAASTAGTLRIGRVAFLGSMRKAAPTVVLYAYDGSQNTILINSMYAGNNRGGCTVLNLSEQGFADISVDNTSAIAIGADQNLTFQFAADAEL